MIGEILTYLNSRLPAGIAQEVRPLCSMVQDGDRIYPALYTGKDQLRNLTSYQWQSGFVFWLTNGDATIEQLDEVRGGKDRVGITFPLRLYWVGSRNVWLTDNQYTGMAVAMRLQQAVAVRNIPTLRTQLGLDRIRTNVTNRTFGREVLTEFLTNVDVKFPYDMEAVRLDVDLEVHGTLECITAESCP